MVCCAIQLLITQSLTHSVLIITGEDAQTSKPKTNPLGSDPSDWNRAWHKPTPPPPPPLGLFSGFGDKNQNSSHRERNVHTPNNDPSSKEAKRLIAEQSHKRQLQDLKYWDAYPKRIRQWISDAKVTRGQYTWKGDWVASGVWDDLLGKDFYHKPVNVKARILDKDLHGGYRFGIEPSEAQRLSSKLREFLSLKYASNSEIASFRIRKAVQEWRRFPGDTGSSEVQIAVLTERINYLNEHAKTHRKDHSAKRQLAKIVARRRRLLKYLKREDVARYYDLITKMNFSDNV